jgi:branched-chain amino acid transport system ATP-binding protein
MSEPILSVANLEAYYGPIMAIRGVSLQVHPGKIVAVLGANGAGKTTLLKTISGILDPRKGSVTFEGKQIQKKDPSAIVLGGLSQVPEGREVFPFLTVRENLVLGAWTRSDHEAIRADIERQFEYFPRLKQKERTPAGLMSGGEQQMLAIARGFVAKPKLMLVDEPTEGLAPMLVQSLTAILGEISRRGSTILLVEQNLEVALALSSRLYVVDQGRIQFEGTPDELRREPTVQQRFLGV